MAETIDELIGNGGKVVTLNQLRFVKQYTDETFVSKNSLGSGFVIDETTGEITIDGSGALTDTTAGWNAQPTLIATKGTIYIYSDYKVVGGKDVPNVKIGDGTSFLSALPFAFTDYTHALDGTIHVTAEEKEKWNNKITYSIDEANETLTLTKE